jgi:outer membrane protein OmpA-like peptidoglycan-associated protein
MNEIPYVTIELGSHTDCRASMAYNDSLSLARSNSVVTYLLNAGIEQERLVAKGYGERQLVNDCGCEGNTGKGLTPECTEEMHQANRRTTAKVLSFDYKPKNAPTEEQIKQQRKGKKKKTEEEENKEEGQ